MKSSFVSNFTQTKFQHYYDDLPFNDGQSMKNPEDAASAPMSSKRVSISPIMRSTSEHGDSTWLAYLKRRAGAEAIQYWIDKSKKNQDYEGFVEWLDMVSQLLDPDTYRYWLVEVQSASANVPEFQTWISLRNSAAYRPTAPSATQGILPVPITDRPKHLFYNDKSFAFTDQRQKSVKAGARQSGDGPPPHLEILAQPRSPLVADYGFLRNFDEAVKNSWKSWQSYHELNPPSLSESVGRMDDTHMISNYTNVPRQDKNEQQMFFTNDQYVTTLKRNNDAALTKNFGAMIDRIGGSNDFQTINAKLDPNQLPAQLGTAVKNDSNLPNLLIYFPPPLNLVIYYSVGNHNNTAVQNVSLQTDGQSEVVGRRMSNSGSYIPEDYDDNPNFYNKTGLMNKQKEFEFIRKIIKELINYWDDGERVFEQSTKFNNEAVDLKMKNFDQSQSHIDTQAGTMKPDEGERKPSYDKFFAWLVKRGHINSTKFSDLSSEGTDRHEKVHIDSSDMEDNKNTTGKISILVDVEKTSEIVKKLFSRNDNGSQNYSDPQQYQLMVNLNEYVGPQEEDLISRKLLNIASKQLHRNMTGNEKIPKVLWVLPVYENEENETLLNEMKKRRKEKVNTLEDVDIPMENTDNNDRTHYMSNNSDVNERNNDNDPKNMDNFNNSMKNTEDEYYDDQDTYYQNEYEESDSDQTIRKGSNKK